MAEPDTAGDIGDRIRIARQGLGLTQREAAERAGLSVGALRDLEQGRRRRPRGSSIRALAEVLGMTLEHLARPDAGVRQSRSGPVDPSGPLRILVLGPLVASRSDVPLAALSGHCRVVLARLALTPNQPVSTAELIRLVWPGRAPATGPNVLQTHVSRLRQVLEAGADDDEPRVLTRTPSGYCLHAGEEQVDILAYRRRLADWRRDAVTHPQRAFDLLNEALELWRGHSAAEDVPELQEDPLVIGLRDDLVEMAVRWGSLGESLRRLPETLPRLRPLAARHGWHERLHARLVVALAASGQQAAALEAYDAIRRRLTEELGIDPGTELEEARRSVLTRGWEEKPAPRPGPEPPGAPASPPAPPADFTGRAEELHRLEQVLRFAPHRAATQPATLCVISGMPGVGKTSLALRAVQAVRQDFPEKPVYLDLRGADQRPAGTAETLTRLLRALGVDGRRIPDDAERTAALYQEVVAGRQLLIVLDNARDAEQVSPLVPPQAGSAVVVTSRNRCAGLPATVHLPLPPLGPAEAIELLTRRLGERQATSDPAATAALAEACGRLPIALRVVNGHLAGNPAQTVRELLDDLRRAPAGHGRPGILPVDASFDLSYRQLDRRCAEVFREATLVPGDTFTAAAVAALTGLGVADVERALRDLAEENLVQAAGAGRYRYHDLLRAYGSRRLALERTPAQRGDGLARLCEWYLARTAAAMRLVYPSMVRLRTDVDDRPMCFEDIDAALAWLDEEVDALAGLIELAADGELRGRAWQLADQLRGYFFVRRDVLRWLATGELGLTAARDAGDLRAQAAMRQTIGQAHWSAGRHELALSAYRHGATAAAASGWTVGQAYLTHNLGLVHAELGHVTEARRLYAEALALGEGDEFIHIRAVTLNDLGTLCSEQGLLAEAVDHFGAALAINRGAARRPSAMANRGNLGMVLRQMEEFGPAREHLEEALGYYRATGSHRNELSLLDELSHLHRQLGELAPALDAAAEALRIAVRLDDVKAQAGVRNTLGLAWLEARAVSDARAHFDAALRLSRERGYAYLEAQAGVGVGQAALAGGDTAGAREAAGEAARTARLRGYSLLAGDASMVLARAALADDDPAAAAAHGRDAAESYGPGGPPDRLRELDRLRTRIVSHA
ncbi:BTAD domain-containing putative transcriptional regulator [Paractinoplanes globisporus]|uniref:BTAD domain-containing putative transcriptional regulator n=1 Tax=Paractinoplanes globisporus TaxID=113565 RepID=A0ABW6WS45_9ACTN|nr:BTAD domain-containing putative transcriptional regulator [Actinoplanes globisporus]